MSNIIKASSIAKDEIMSLMGGRAGFIFEYSQLVKSIPRSLIDSCITDSVPSIDSQFYKVPEVNGLKRIFDLTTKDIYAILLQNETFDNKSTEYWKIKFQTDHFDYNLWYKKLFVCKIMPKKVLDFNWRIFHGQLVTEKRLINMRLSDGKCTLCKLEIEDVTHIFVKCPSYKSIWIYIANILDKINVPKLQEFNMIVGFLHDGFLYDVVNTIISIARWMIWKRRCSSKFEKNYEEKANIVYEFKYTLQRHFKMVLQSKINSEKSIEECLNMILTIL